ncbi:hypothetical protein O181_064317, partial [Austropuccinia psidii MF-1]|nr:hypothetical protein [Austropuccinia psidii MF-1]
MEGNIEISSIPLLDGSNYGEWNARITILLRSKDLLHVCEGLVASDASTAALSKCNKSRFDTISIITSPVSNQVFIEVVKQNFTNSYLLWTKIQEKYASKKSINHGRVWTQCVPSELLSLTLLRKLSGDPKIHQYVAALSLNEELIEIPDLIVLKLQDYHQNSTIQPDSSSSSATSLLSESSHRYKILYYCTNAQSNSSVSAHLSTAQALVTGNNLSTSCSNLITDCGATHHMFKSKEMLSSLNTTPPVSVCTGDLSSSLLTKGTGLLCLGHKEVSINQDNGAFILKSKEDTLLKGKIVNSLMKVNYSTPKALTIQISDLWHSRLGHSGNHAIKSMGLPAMSSQFLTFSKNKMHTLPFKDHFEQVSLPLGCVHLDLMGPISPTSVSQSRYFLTVVDQATSFKIVKILKTKSDVFQQFLIVKKSMENLHDQTLKRFVSYRG